MMSDAADELSAQHQPPGRAFETLPGMRLAIFRFDLIVCFQFFQMRNQLRFAR
jgi:hypothetical protein